MPISAVLGDNEIMDQIKPGEHGSTFGGSPLAARTALAALNVMFEEKLVENSEKMGRLMLEKLRRIFDKEGRNGKYVKEVRGVGLFMAVEFEESSLAEGLSKRLLVNGVIAKPTHKTILKMTPPLVLTEEQVKRICSALEKSWSEVDELK
jgi:ornithine--oxo-acid transaminase